MAAFKEDPEEWQRLDWQLLQNSPIALYFKKAVLDSDVAWFGAHEYQVRSVQVADIQNPERLLVEVGKVLAFPDYYGRNLDAFNDCLCDVEVPHTGGLVLVFNQFDRFARSNHSFAQQILDVCADNSRRFLLTGRRFVVLVQSDDPQIAFEDVGATAVTWNPQEWINSRRGV